MSKSTQKFWKVFLFMSMYTSITIALICAMSGVLLANEGHSQPLTSVYVSLDLKNSDLTKILSAIEKQTSFEFSYTDEIRSITQLSIHVRNKSLNSVLGDLERTANVSFRQFNKTIAVSKRAAQRSALPSRVNGKVTDSQTGEALPGVSVLLKGTATGTTTDTKGEFTLDVPDDGTLLFSFIGYGTQEISVNAQTSITVSLVANSSTLNEVVVIGYGELEKTRITGAVSQVKSKELNSYNGSSFAQQLSGRAAGVVINDASAQPGTNPQILIRGIGTLTAGRYPLIVVDGFPLSEGSSFNSVPPQDIETIDILKDPASAGIYGSRAANGVILITTKKGKSEKLQVTLDAYTGVQERADKMKYANAKEAALFFTEARDYGYVSKDPLRRSATDDRATRIANGASLRELRLNYLQPYLDGQPGLTDTNWSDEVFRKGTMQNYSLSFSGGSAKTNYFVSANYFNQEGIVINNSLRRYSGSIRLDSKLSKRIDFGLSLAPSVNIQNYFDNNGNSSNDPLAGLEIMYPFFSPYNADGTLAISQQIIANTPEDGALAENPVALMNKIRYIRSFYRTFGNSFVSYELLKGLKLKTLVGADLVSNLADFYNPSDVGQYRGAAPKPASAIEGRDLNINYLIENTLNYSLHHGEHSLDAVAGYTFQKEDAKNTSVTGSSIADNNLPNIGGASAFSVVANRYVWVQVSYLARAQYAYRNTYLFSATIRRDGSSRFGNNSKWGNFPSVTAGWIASNESFFPKSKALTFAKLRATWGQAGNNQIGSYSSKSQVVSGNYVYGNSPASGFGATTIGNPNLSWETKTSVDIGLNLEFLDRFALTADYYNSDTKDLLLNVPVPEQSGFSTSVQNIGKVRNKGLELELSANDIDLGAVKLSLSGNIATNKNEVLALAPGQKQILTGTESNFLTRVGGPVAQLYGYHVTGIFKTQEQINSTPHLPGTLPGDYIVEDITGEGQITQDDRKAFGTYNPKYTYGFSGNLSYKNFEFSFALYGIQGRTLYDRGMALQEESGEGFGVPSKYYFDHRYHPVDNPDGFLGQPNLGNFSNNRKAVRASNLFYKDADYLRIRNVQLAYNLPTKWLSGVNMTRVRIYATANNLFTFTKYRGFNPDGTPLDNGVANNGITNNNGLTNTTQINNVLTNGLTSTTYPVARSYVFGVTASF